METVYALAKTANEGFACLQAELAQDKPAEGSKIGAYKAISVLKVRMAVRAVWSASHSDNVRRVLVAML